MESEAKSYWNILYTRPRAQKKAAMELAALGAQVYCPTVEVLSQWSDRKKRIQKPALPSTVLVKEDTPDRILFSCKNIRGRMAYKGLTSRVSQVEVNRLRDFLNGGYNVEGTQIRIGNNITVPVLQKEGTIVKIKGNDCWVQLANASMTVSFSLS
ncbi:MAG: transcription termination/antitermination NusG family protein [Flavobacteriaceae bacterium]